MTTNFATPTERPRLRACVEQQYDSAGDIVWTLMLVATTYDRRALDVLAEKVGCELEFIPVDKWWAS